MRKILCFAVLCFSLLATAQQKPAPSKPYSCVAGPDELCMSDIFYADYVRWKALQAEVAKDLQSPALLAIQNKQDQLNGMTQRLAGQVQTLTQQHPGFTFDDEKVRLVKAPPAKEPAPAPVPPKK
jgi:hypothetical protein